MNACFAYESLTTGPCKVDRTREVYKMLQEYNITGTPEVYTIAVRSCSQIGDLEFGLGIYDDMKRNGVRPDEVLFIHQASSSHFQIPFIWHISLSSKKDAWRWKC